MPVQAAQRQQFIPNGRFDQRREQGGASVTLDETLAIPGMQAAWRSLAFFHQRSWKVYDIPLVQRFVFGLVETVDEGIAQPFRGCGPVEIWRSRLAACNGFPVTQVSCTRWQQAWVGLNHVQEMSDGYRGLAQVEPVEARPTLQQGIKAFRGEYLLRRSLTDQA
ncbi:hypothetical protein XbrCFBP1976_18390 [Xanthomonas bromi]|uniref:Uncharacterized protein n=1 Tax=Xanthomonas bromi TaxID=56449 RepID=A0ABX5BMJ5_9XANT|nr:hypothetical protein XbrCFBP1976_18390 [Xanthomonas bromi]